MAFGGNNFYPPSVGSFQIPVIPPDSDPDEGQQVTVCFAESWLPFVVGALQQLTLQATWQGDEDAIFLAQSRAQTLIAMFGEGTGSCTEAVCIKGLSYDPDTDTILQESPSGGESVENPLADPRHSDVFRFPPIDADDPKCQASANMVRFINDLIDEVLGVVSAATTAEGLLAVLLPLFLELGPFAILIDLILALAFVLFSAGATLIDEAFTNDVYDQLLCIFYCHVSADGQVNAEQLSAILAQVGVDIGGLVYDVLSAMFFLMGEVGLSNAGVQGDAPADCDDCECAWTWEWDFTIDQQGWDVYGVYGNYVSGQGFESVPVSTAYSLIMVNTQTISFTSQHVQITVGYNTDPTVDGSRVLQYGDHSGATFTPAWTFTPIASPNPNTYEHLATENWANPLYINPNGGNNAITATVKVLRISGIGSVPAFSHGYQV